MIQSMTGYGKVSFEAGGRNITIEIRSLNSRQADINLRLPSIFREKENELRGLIANRLDRGKIDVNISAASTDVSHVPRLNIELARSYYEQINNMVDLLKLDARSTDFVSLLLRMPDVMQSPDESIQPEEWETLSNHMNQAIDLVIQFRRQEGEILLRDFTQRTEKILRLLLEVEKHESERIGIIRTKILKELEALPSQVSYDKNRFEQEMIYWLEKIDFTEEKVRLRKHCRLFLDTMQMESSQGRKLGFIAQEMGREINTLGSKANHAVIQQLVIEMKDELEKIKEQLLNIL
ncbi:MAG: YicC/YloC family endoribonuclease [Bacteroidales bacterium]